MNTHRTLHPIVKGLGKGAMMLALAVLLSSFANPSIKSLLENKREMVTIVSVSAINTGTTINVSWTIRNQKTEGTYLVERSMDNETFEIIGLKKAVITSKRGKAELTFNDTEATEGKTYFYRVRHFGNDNTELTSRSVMVSN